MNKSKGISLLEILVAVAIIGVLAALTLPALKKARESGRRIACMNNLRQIGLGLGMYLEDYQFYPSLGYNDREGRYPVVGYWYKHTWLDDVTDYLKNIDVWKCPSVNNYGPPPIPEPKFSYAFNWNFLNSDQIYGAPVKSGTEDNDKIVVADGRTNVGNERWWTVAYVYWGDHLPREPWQHNRGCNALFPDMHVEWLSKDSQRLSSGLSGPGFR